jgi:hypothetical protein
MFRFSYDNYFDHNDNHNDCHSYGHGYHDSKGNGSNSGLETQHVSSCWYVLFFFSFATLMFILGSRNTGPHRNGDGSNSSMGSKRITF